MWSTEQLHCFRRPSASSLPLSQFSQAVQTFVLHPCSLHPCVVESFVSLYPFWRLRSCVKFAGGLASEWTTDHRCSVRAAAALSSSLCLAKRWLQ